MLERYYTHTVIHNADHPAFGLNTSALLWLEENVTDVHLRRKITSTLGRIQQVISDISEMKNTSLGRQLWQLWRTERRAQLQITYVGQTGIFTNLCNHICAMAGKKLGD